MADCNILTGLTDGSKDNFQFGVGVLYKNVTNPAAMDLDSMTADNFIGATTDEISVAANPEMIDMYENVGGAYGKFVGGDIIDYWEITMTATLLEVTAQNLKLAIGSADITDNASKPNSEVITPRNCIEDADYLTNLCWFGQLKDKRKVVIEMKNVINQGGLTFGAFKKEKGTIECEFSPRYKTSAPNDVPLRIYIEKKI